jgi:hypothetical protein
MSVDFFDRAIQSVERPLPHQLDTGGNFWRMDDPVIVYEGEAKRVVKGGFFEHQRRWWNLPNYIKILVGGYGAGKTSINCKRAISSALLNAPAPVAMVSPTHSIARQTIVATVATLLAGKERIYGKHRFWWKYFKKESVFKIRYQGRDATIIVYSGEDPLSLRGPNLAAAYIDEPFIQDEEVFKQMIARVRHPAAAKREIGMTGTPEEISNWGYDLCVGSSASRHDAGFIRASTKWNQALPDEYVANLEGAFDGKAANAYIEGEFENLAKGAVYYAFDSTNGTNVVEKAIPDDAELGCGMDFNVNPMCAAVFWKRGDHMHYFDAIELANADTELMCEELRRKYVYDGQRITKQVLRNIYPDASGNFRKTASPEGKTDFHYIRAAGFIIRANATNPKRKDRWNAVNGKFKPKVGETTLTISPKCKTLIKYLSVASHERRHSQKQIEHMLDAFGYPVAHLFPIVYQRPMKRIIGF